MSSTSKRSKWSTHQEHDELWLISYADMVTLLLGFFVILYSLSQVDEKKFSELGNELAKSLGSESIKHDKTLDEGSLATKQLRAFQMLVAMLNLGSTPEAAVDHVQQAAANASRQKAMQALLDANLAHVPLDTEPGRTAGAASTASSVSLVLPGKLLFPPGSAVLSLAGRKEVGAIAASLTQLGGLLEVDIEGHTDSRPPHAGLVFADNYALSAARAGAVAALLIREGVAKELVRAEGLADLRPLFPEHRPDGSLDPEAMEKNRRVHIGIKLRKATHAEQPSGRN